MLHSVHMFVHPQPLCSEATASSPQRHAILTSGCDAQEQVQHVHSQTTHSPNIGPSHRLKLSAELLDPLCHGLGHAVYRLAMATSQHTGTQSAGRKDLAESVYQQNVSAATTGAATSIGPALRGFVAGESGPT